MAMPKTVKLFRRELSVNSLWLWWYALLILIGEGFLVHRAVDRCKEYNEHQWKADQKPVRELYTYIVLIVLSVVCMPCFLITCIFKVGNLASDGTRFGKDPDTIDVGGICGGDTGLVITEGQRAAEEGDGREQPKGGPGILRNIWRHMGPLNNCLHVVAAFALLLPDTLLKAQEIKYGFVTPDNLGQSDLDILFGRNVLYKDSIIYNSGDINTSRLIVAPAVYRREKVHGVSPEFANYLLALVVYSLRYAAVFWHAKMTFSLVFSAMLMVATVNYVITFCGLGILYKFQVNKDAFQDLDFLLLAPAAIILSILAYTAIYLSFISVARYGHLHYIESWTKFIKRYFPHLVRRGEDSSLVCQGYLPHTMAAFALVCFVAFKAPVVFDLVSLYKNTNSAIILTCVLLDVTYMIVWVVAWFALTLKQSWDFRISPCPQCFRNTASLGGARPRQKPPRPQSAPEVMSAFVPPSTADESNGQITVDSEDDCQLNHASALRKSRDRKNANHPRVTFDESISSAATPPSRQNNGQSEPGHAAYTLAPQTVVRPMSDCLLEEKSARMVSEMYPDNTLSKTYRNSLRDRCGRYYRPGEFSPPPAAQSSPVVSHKAVNPDESGEIILDARNLSGAEHPPQPPKKPSRKSQPPGRPPRGYRRRDMAVPLVQEDSFSSATVSDGAPPRPIKQFRRPQRYRPDIQGHQDSFELSSLSSSRTESPHLQMEGLSHHQGRRPLPRERVRPITISTKPDLHRRDSALPSSNETSSNESGDVLCSQV